MWGDFMECLAETVMTNLCSFIGAFLLGLGSLIVWIIFYYPINVKRNLIDVGFYHIKEKAKNATERANLINRSRRLRYVGEKIPPPYPNGWFCVLESDELPIGTAKSVDCLGQNFAIFRDTDGVVHILDAYCPHIGANLGVGGRVKGNCIECPFHQWRFRGTDGELTEIPYTTGSIPKAKVKAWKSCESGGFVFVWHHVDDVEPWSIPGVKEVENGSWAYHGRNEYFVNCHIQEIPENGADPAHLQAVHGPSIAAGSDLRTTRSFRSIIANHSWFAAWSLTETSHIAHVELTHSICLFNKFNVCEMSIRTKQIGPGYVELMMETNYGPMVCLQTVTPVEPMVQKVIHRFYSPRYMAWFSKFSLLGECVQFERDVMVWNNKKFVDNPTLVREDRQIKAYRTWYSQFYSVHSRPFFGANTDQLDW